MAVQKRLDMRFRNQAGRLVTLRVDDPKDDLTAAEVQAAMQVIINANIFTSSGGDLVDIDSARIVQTDTTYLVGEG